MCAAAVPSAADGVLGIMGGNIVHCGDVGTGEVAKLCNNLVLAISMAGVAEGQLLGQRLGVDKKVLAGIFNTSSARCWSSTCTPTQRCAGTWPTSRAPRSCGTSA